MLLASPVVLVVVVVVDVFVEAAAAAAGSELLLLLQWAKIKVDAEIQAICTRRRKKEIRILSPRKTVFIGIDKNQKILSVCM